MTKYEYLAELEKNLDMLSYEDKNQAMEYYENYFDVYPEKYDKTKLDENQQKGLVNSYKAFTPPRKIPTFFCIAPER